mmetsp:Transcript_13165/g.26864  ORF Transcript_13165/g.26864 Transcript_13165/m.26864 type:complete len:431 (+) Transcript_13165:1042-2334(+)
MVHLPEVVVGVGGLGMHGCEFGLHPDSFRARLDALLSFRRSVLSTLGIVDLPLPTPTPLPPSNGSVCEQQQISASESESASTLTSNEGSVLTPPLKASDAAANTARENACGVNVGGADTLSPITAMTPLSLLVNATNPEKKGEKERQYIHLQNADEKMATVEVEEGIEDDKVVRVLLLQRKDHRRFANADDLVAALVQGGGGGGGGGRGFGFRLAMETTFFEGATMATQVKAVFAADILIAVDGTGLANAPFMRNGSGVVAIGRACSKDRPCFWDGACTLLGQKGPNWEQWATSTTSSAAAGCTPAFANRLCAEMWRPFIDTRYVDTKPNAPPPLEADVPAVASATMSLASQIHSQRRERKQSSRRINTYNGCLEVFISSSQGPSFHGVPGDGQRQRRGEEEIEGLAADTAARAFAKARGGVTWGDGHLL